MSTLDAHVEQRFRAKVDTAGPTPAHAPELGPCHLWLAHVDPRTGYGRFKLDDKLRLAHRVAWAIHHGVEYPPRGVVIMHRCDVQRCVNPLHLKRGTQSENLIDRHQKGRDPKHMGKGEANARAKLTEDDVRYIRANPDGLSMCEIARRLHVSFSLVCGIKRGDRWEHVA